MISVLIPASVLIAQPPDDLHKYGSYRVARTGVVIPADQLRMIDSSLFEWRIK